MSDLKRCPFCGGEGEAVPDTCVECSRCGARGPYRKGEGLFLSYAAGWNSRPLDRYGWISVENGLPELAVPVLARSQYMGINVYHVAHMLERGVWRVSSGSAVIFPTHWMVIPTPPKADEKELKPCPCCGGESVYVRVAGGDSETVETVMCSNCGLRAVARFGDEGEAVKRWNRRVGDSDGRA